MAARTRFTAGVVPLDDPSAGGGLGLARRLASAVAVTVAVAVAGRLAGGAGTPILFAHWVLIGLQVCRVAQLPEKATDAQCVARHVGIVREIHNATRFRVATFERCPRSTKSQTRRLSDENPPRRFVRKKGVLFCGCLGLHDAERGRSLVRLARDFDVRRFPGCCCLW